MRPGRRGGPAYVRVLGSTMLAVAMGLALSVVPAIGQPGIDEPPRPQRQPADASPTTTIRFEVTYRNREGSEADWVRVLHRRRPTRHVAGRWLLEGRDAPPVRRQAGPGHAPDRVQGHGPRPLRRRRRRRRGAHPRADPAAHPRPRPSRPRNRRRSRRPIRRPIRRRARHRTRHRGPRLPRPARRSPIRPRAPAPAATPGDHGWDPRPHAERGSDVHLDPVGRAEHDGPPERFGGSVAAPGDIRAVDPTGDELRLAVGLPGGHRHRDRDRRHGLERHRQRRQRQRLREAPAAPAGQARTRMRLRR